LLTESVARDTGRIDPDIYQVSFDYYCKCLSELLQVVAQQGYQFTTVTPLTHERFLARGAAEGKTLRDIFGWNLPFRMAALSPVLRTLMTDAGVVDSNGEYLRSKVRIASLGDDLFLHSSFPTNAADTVFFGPDTYRFARFIRHSLNDINFLSKQKNLDEPMRILDIGCGSGAGGIVAVRALPAEMPFNLTMNDINSTALDYTRINTTVANISASFLHGDIFSTPAAEFDLIISNPPYMRDAAGRTYRDGGARLGRELSVDIAKYALEHLAPGGRLLLYTGVVMTGESDPFLAELLPILADGNCRWSYEEIDPDIFGEELEQPLYMGAHRIAAVGLIAIKR